MSEVIMLVNVVEEEEARIAIVEDGRLGELFVERASRDNIVGNIYKGRVVNVARSIEAAFVEFGFRKHGFLHVSDIKSSAVGESGGGGGRGRRGDVTKLVRGGKEVVVQVTKEGIGDKGPALTTYLSLPGRFLVLMPGMSLRGVSRRISDDGERKRVKQMVASLEVPDDVGVIARTASLSVAKRELERDLDYLVRLWKTIKGRAEHSRAPATLYEETDHVIRVIRDVFHEEIRRIVVDSPDVHRRVQEFLRETMPHHVRKVKLYSGGEPLFHHFGVEKEIAKMNSRSVALPCGGSIVMDQTEALVAIDVNSGTFKGERDPEKAALKINLEAAEEIARQVRVRDLGGVVVMDFIDMQDKDRRAKVDKLLWDSLKRDKSRISMLKMSDFGIVEMTRQRRRASLRQTHYVDCPTCRSTGHVKSAETMGLELVRTMRLGLERKDVAHVNLEVTPAVANYLNNTMRARLAQLEKDSGKDIVVHASPGLNMEEHKISFLKKDGALVKVG